MRSGLRSPKRILLVTPQPFVSDRGTPIAIHQVVRAMSELGYHVDVLTYPVGRHAELPGVSIFRVPNPFRFRDVPVGLSARKLLLDALLTVSLYRRLRSGVYDALHAVEEAAFPAAWLGRRYGTIVVYDMQSSLPEQLAKHRLLRGPGVQQILRRFERWLIQRADRVIASGGLASRVSEIGPDTQVSEWSFLGEPQIAGDDEARSLRKHLGIPSGAPVVLYTGTFEEYQGIPLLLDAASAVRRSIPQAAFVIVGAGPKDSDSLEAARIGGPVTDTTGVWLLPRQPRDRMPAYLAMADIVVSPRIHGSNVPLKIFDYLGAGRPIVATDLPMHRAVLGDETAVLVPPTADALSAAIVLLIEDPARRAQLSEAARTFARERLSWERFVRSIRDLYEV
jgi:glycosyltransferase involved in cell wall biosynthesis